MDIFHVISLSLLSLQFNFTKLENKLVALSLRVFSFSYIHLLALSHSNNSFIV